MASLIFRIKQYLVCHIKPIEMQVNFVKGKEINNIGFEPRSAESLVRCSTRAI